MNWEIIFVFVVLAAALASFIREKISTDLTAMIAFGLILVAGALPWAQNLPSIDQMLGVFSSAAPITIAAMFIVSAALEKCGAIERMATGLGHLVRFGYVPVLLLMILVAAFSSAFINNTPVVVIFLPVVLSLSRQLKVPASKLLIPLSYASIFGGICTLVGTSTNILASDILRNSGSEPLSMFELSKLGIPLLIAGTLYLVFIGRKILPRRESLTSILTEEERKEYLTEAYVRPGSPIIGQSVTESGLLRGRGIRLLELIRNEVALKQDLRLVRLQAGDRLILSCRPAGFVHVSSLQGLNLLGDASLGLETIAAHEGSIVEGIIAPRASIAGRTIRDLNFRQRFRMVLIAIHRKGINMRDKIDTLPLEPGDTILMMGTDQAREEIRRGDDILLLDHPPTPAKDMRKKIPVVLGTLAGIVLSATFGLMPISAAAIIGVVVLFLSGAIKPAEGYAAIEWSLLLLIYGMLGVGLAMETTGASQLLADSLVGLTHMGIPPHLQPYVLLAGIYVMTSIFTEVLSNNATVVIMTPIAIGLGTTLGVDPRPFAIAACIASSASFATPIGYQTNTYVYGVGGYKFADFLKVGIPLNLACMCLSIVLIPLLWDF